MSLARQQCANGLLEKEETEVEETVVEDNEVVLALYIGRVSLKHLETNANQGE